MRKITRVFIHCSDSPFGDADAIEEWHRSRFSQSPSGKHIGYHYVVLNGRRKKADEYSASDDGLVENGRPLDEPGAHVAGSNFDSIGVCLIGKDGLYTVAQLRAAAHLVRTLIEGHRLSWSAIYGHYQAQTADGKTCPDFNIEHFRSLVRGDR